MAGAVAVDLDTAYKSEVNHNVGLSARYRRKLGRNVNWSIQANITNALQAHDKLTPTRTQPDGSMLGAMIREGRSWSVTNTLEF